ncbi:MAG: DUF86 domain-containing protein [Candidatus Nanohaloarchaea archaeon]
MDERVEERIDALQEYLRRVEEVASSAEDTMAVQEAKENLLRKIASSAIDIAARLIALNEYRRPDTYAEYFAVLAENDVLSDDLADRLEEMARFRNLVVHQYQTVSEEELDAIIDDDLDDVEAFIAAVERASDGGIGDG